MLELSNNLYPKRDVQRVGWDQAGGRGHSRQAAWEWGAEEEEGAIIPQVGWPLALGSEQGSDLEES